MNNRVVALASVGACVVAILFYCIMNNIIIVRSFSSFSLEKKIKESLKEQKKQITLFFFKNNTLKQEIEQIIFTHNKQENSMIVVNRWLTLLLDESLTPFRVTLQSAAYDHSEKKLILSFDQSFLSPADPVYKKIACIETLLKTIKTNLPHVQELFILVNHQPLSDAHLDFSRTWPIDGFTPLE